MSTPPWNCQAGLGRTLVPLIPPLCYWCRGGPGWRANGDWLVTGWRVQHLCHPGAIHQAAAPLRQSPVFPLKPSPSATKPCTHAQLCPAEKWAGLRMQGSQASSWPGVRQEAEPGHTQGRVPSQSPACFMIKATSPNLSDPPFLHLQNGVALSPPPDKQGHCEACRQPQPWGIFGVGEDAVLGNGSGQLWGSVPLS